MGLRSFHRPLFERSAAHFTRAYELNPSNPAALIQRGIVRWRELDDFEGAIADFDRVLLVDRSQADVLFYRAMAHNRGGNYIATVQDLERVIDVAPESRLARDAFVQLQSLYQIMDELPRSQRKLDSSRPILLGPPNADTPPESPAEE